MAAAAQLDWLLLCDVLRRAAVPSVVATLVCRRWHGASVGACRNRVRSAARYAIAAPRVSCLAWLLQRTHMPSSRSLWDLSARRGRLDALRVLLRHAGRLPHDGARLCALAALGGGVATLRWLRACGCAWDERVCACAAYAGRLSVLRWAVRAGCPLGARGCAFAALEGRPRVLRWLRAHGCPWDERVCAFAARRGHLRLLRWAAARGAPHGEWTRAELDAAASDATTMAVAHAAGT